MKLRNKRTGEIGKPAFIGVDYEITILPEDKNKKARYYKTLAELNEEWCDYEEPKEYWAIDIYSKGAEDFKNSNDDVDKFNKEIGNYFETKEEAEKAVEKLKCFTNLKNHEFMFDGWYYGTDGNIVILANAHEFNDMEEQDLTKVFGEKIC